MMCSEPRSASSASGRSSPCVSEMTPMIVEFFGSCAINVLGRARLQRFRSCTCDWMLSTSAALHLFEEPADADHRPSNRAATDFLKVIPGSHAHGVEASVERLQQGLRRDVRTNAARGTMLDVYRCSDRDLVAFAIGL